MLLHDSSTRLSSFVSHFVATDEERCENFNEAYGALQELPKAIGAVSRAWNSSAHQYVSCKNNLTVNDTYLQGKAAIVTQISDDVSKLLLQLNVTNSAALLAIRRNLTRGHL